MDAKIKTFNGVQTIITSDGRIFVEAAYFSAGAGYQYTKIRRQNFAVHRLVAEAFIGPPGKGQETNHKDLNKQNNDVSNLEWVDHQENVDHYYRVKKISQYKKLIWAEYQQYFGIRGGLTETSLSDPPEHTGKTIKDAITEVLSEEGQLLAPS